MIKEGKEKEKKGKSVLFFSFYSAFIQLLFSFYSAFIQLFSVKN
jgi:hypothetical protein